MSEKGVISVENLTPEGLQDKELKTTEAELYRIFSKYKKASDSKSTKYYTEEAVK